MSSSNFGLRSANSETADSDSSLLPYQVRTEFRNCRFAFNASLDEISMLHSLSQLSLVYCCCAIRNPSFAIADSYSPPMLLSCFA